ncbi:MULTISPECIES: hypothetical protein [Enterobacter cloacae complex]|uniref:Uncharacterized protein n=1 Tax=Enterobacter genomosp. O TaxID=2364150 RepID=A0A0X4EDJ5_9ENTR|nr:MULTISPECIES: hypothetical protein [Enterobacter cloacae complex]KUQ79658.1 hypothetical protein AWI28_05335 [Enterobacter genomosp. O]KZQ31780.1 hypothetical protein A3464_21460 [Enterobacter genomosp. O]MCM7109242.1 hypothetical protein [Enterobacter cloacae]
MKKTLLLILTIVLLIIAVFTTADLSQSAWYVFSLEKITTTSAGLLFGKLVFLLVILLALYFSLKFLRKLKP